MDGAAGEGGKVAFHGSYSYGGGGGGFTGGASGSGTSGDTGQTGGVAGSTFAGGSGSGGHGGYGGGGGGGYGGGGGGGYGGGGGGGGGASGGGGGGGSFDETAAFDAVETGAINAGDGLVTLTALSAPTITVASPAAHSATATTPVDPFAGDAIVDPNVGSPTETLTVTPSTTALGVLSDPAAGTDGSSIDPTTGAFSVSGTVQEVTTALDNLVFTPDAPGTTTFTISDFSSAYPLTVSDSTTTVADAICFCAGTHIATPTGEVAVETLKRGDLVLTYDKRSVPVVWLGIQTVSRLFADPLRTNPIRIRAGALGDAVPTRDLRVSPDHALLVGDVLIHAGALVNGTSIVRETQVPETFVYYHVETDDHSLILAENTPAETFIDNVDRRGFDNWAEHEALYPKGKPLGEMDFPRARARRQVPMWMRVALNERAEKLVSGPKAA
jgi:hypothetical protein